MNTKVRAHRTAGKGYAMFGFIRPVKAELRVKEADRFQQVYCGLCHAIRAEYGRFYTLFLSYDMTFFALVAGSEEAETAPPCRKRCDASPFRRKSCAETDDALRLAADASILLTYHKFQDDLADEKGAKRALAALLCRLGRRGYEKARARMPEADEDIRQALEDLRRLEAERCSSMDRAADTSSRMTAAVVPRTGDTRERILHQMFYQIGRWIYLVDAGVEVKYGGKNYRIDPKAVYQKKHYQIEPDVSAACYFYAAAAITGGRTLVKHVHKDNSQGDMKFLDVLAQMGCTVTEKADGIEVTGPAEDTLKGIEIDMNDFSDQALTLAAMAPFCNSDVHITHIGHIRGQECDRLHAMSEELTKRGITCTEEPDAITIKPGIPSAGIVTTYEDHRVAMSFALLGLKVDGIVIDNPSCCRKTFENYFDLLDQLSGKDR